MKEPSARSVAAALIAIAVTGAFLAPLFAGPPTVTVENHDADQRYRVTAYAVPNVDEPWHIDLRATTDDGRDAVSFEEAYWGRDYRNLTITSPTRSNATTVVPANGNATVELDGYRRADVVVYVVETIDTERLVHFDVDTCGEPDPTIRVAVADGAFQNGSSVCA